MPDPNITVTAINTHATALEGAIRRYAANAVRCKVWSVVVVAGVMVFAVGRTQMAALPWAAAPVVLPAMADACQVVMARCCTDAYNAFIRKLPLNGGNATKAEECFVLSAPEPEWRQAGQMLGALGSLSVLPFYGAVLALVVAFYVQSSGGLGDSGSGGLGEGEKGRLGERNAANPVQSAANTLQSAQPSPASLRSAGALPESIATRSASARQPSMPMSSTRLPPKAFSLPGPLVKVAMALVRNAAVRDGRRRMLVGGGQWYGCGGSVVRRATGAAGFKRVAKAHGCWRTVVATFVPVILPQAGGARRCW